MEQRIGALVTTFAAALQVALEDDDKAGIPKPKMVTALPGAQVAFDYCDEGGMAWARLVGITTVQQVQGNQCVVEYEVTIELAILRCAPTIDESGNLPSSDEQLAAFLQQMHDMGTMHKVLTCTPTPVTYSAFVLGDYNPVGPDGGCIGGFWQATARFA